MPQPRPSVTTQQQGSNHQDVAHGDVQVPSAPEIVENNPDYPPQYCELDITGLPSYEQSCKRQYGPTIWD